MADADDMDLLGRFAEENSEPLFAELVGRYINLVFSVALRCVGNAHAAEDITQAVFIILARKAGKLPKQTVLSGWLYHTARLTASNYLRGEMRRQKREQEAVVQSTLNESEPEAWLQIAPMLDDAMSGLGERDRNAIVLRFFENKSLRDVGTHLGTSEDAAKMRVNRAVEKLRKFFLKRGVSCSAVAVAAAMSTHSVQAAPIGLAASVTAVSLTKGAAAGGSILTLVKGAMKMMTWLKVKSALIAGSVVLLAAGTGTVAVVGLEKENTDGPQELRCRWEVGKKYSMHLEVDQNTILRLPTMPVNQHVLLSEDYDITPVRALENNGWELSVQFGQQRIESSQDGRKVVSFDSTQDPSLDTTNPAAPILRAVAGSTLRMFTDPKGKVVRVEGGEALRGRITATTSSHQQNPIGQIIAATFGEMFSDGNLKELYGGVGSMLPDHPVKTGDRWPYTMDYSSSIGTLGVNVDFTFGKWEQRNGFRCARLDKTGTISSKSTSTALGVVVKIQKGELTGPTWFDPELGMFREVNTEEHIVMKITTREQVLTQQLDSNIRVYLLSVTN